MDLSISEQQELLLYKACQNNGVLPITLARQMYSSKSSANSAVDKLELAGFIERVTPGYWKVVKVTPDIKERLGAESSVVKKKEKGTESNEGTGSTESKFEIEQVS